MIVAGVLAVAYGLTLAPGLTWANRGDDGGDLIAAAATLGVAHPTGYPTYLLLAHLFQQLPVSNLAFRTTLLSAASAVGAALAVQALLARWRNPAAGLVGGLALGLSALVWSQAVIAEVYTLHALGLALILLAIARLTDKQTALTRADEALALVAGLALGHHLTTLFILPAYLGAIIYRRHYRLWLAFSAGLAVWLYIPLRAAAQPPVNWGEASTLSGWWWVVSGAPYHALAFHIPLNQIVLRILASLQFLRAQWNWPGLALGLAGMFVPLPRFTRATLFWLALVSFIFAVEYNADDYFVHLLPLYLVFSIWIGLGAAALTEWAARRWARARGVLLLTGAVWLTWHLSVVGPRASARADQRAEQFLQTVLAQAPPHALISARTDRDSFALWYARFALGARPDLTIVVQPMFPYAWYRANLRAAFPGLTVPDLPALTGDQLAELNGLPFCWTEPDSASPLKCSETP